MHAFVRAALLLLAPLLVQASHAAAVVLWPVDPVIAADQRSTAIWIENRGDTPVTMQIRSLAWQQQAGEDSYAMQDAVVSSPPIARIAPGTRQLVRLIRRATTQEPGEQAYRLLIDEVPEAPKPDAAGATAALAVQMRYSIPLFTYSAGGTGGERLSSRMLIEDGHRYLEISNAGTRHARLTDLRWKQGGRTVSLASGLLGYVLPGAMRRFALPDGLAGSGDLVVKVDGVDRPLTATA